MSKRMRMSKHYSRTVYRKGSDRIHRKNFLVGSMRGGIRL